MATVDDEPGLGRLPRRVAGISHARALTPATAWAGNTRGLPGPSSPALPSATTASLPTSPASSPTAPPCRSAGTTLPLCRRYAGTTLPLCRLRYAGTAISWGAGSGSRHTRHGVTVSSFWAGYRWVCPSLLSVPVEFLTDEQAAVYGHFTGPLTQAKLERYFFLNDSDKTLIRRRRGDHSRLGFGLQLVTVRYLGTFLTDPAAGRPRPGRAEVEVIKSRGVKGKGPVTFIVDPRWAPGPRRCAGTGTTGRPAPA